MLKCHLVRFCLVFVSAFVLIACSSGERLVNNKCNTRCHSTAEVYKKPLSAAQWKLTLSDMKMLGLKVTSEQEKQILDYLIGEHGTK